jgi:membrane-associated phospholipid phosphatase
MLASAMTMSAEGIVGYWDGVPAQPFPTWPAGWTGFQRLQGDAKLAVLQHDLAPLFRVGAGAGVGQFAVSVPGPAALLTLTPPTTAQLAAQLPHVRTASDIRADRLPEILAQMGDMLSFYAGHFRLHPDQRKWTLLLLAAAYEAVLIPEMRMKFEANLPRPIDFDVRVQPIIGTPAHSTYPSGHATEAFAFATVLCGLKKMGRGVANPVAAVLADLQSGTGATMVDTLPFQLAARIADNRTVAGVHFPVDSAHGGLLGMACGLAFLAACIPGQTSVPLWEASGANWQTDFTLSGWVTALTTPVGLGGWDTGNTVAVNGAAAGSPLDDLLQQAAAEWQ